jgi:hypothetical protein
MSTPTSYLSYFVTKGRYFNVLPHGGTDERTIQFLSIIGLYNDTEYLLVIPKCSTIQIRVRNDFAYYDNMGPFTGSDVLDSMKHAIKYQSLLWCHRLIVNLRFTTEDQNSLFEFAWELRDRYILGLFRKLSFPQEVPLNIRETAKNFQAISEVVLNW